jgi:hypothetical protein
MSKSDRSTHTDALATLGTIIGEGEKRDAIHLAVEPAVAAHTLRPGQDVGIADGVAGASTNPVGIVDPFLKGAVEKGQRFWLVVYPRQITSLRHVWTHPAFGEEGVPTLTPTDDQKRASEAWLRDFVSRSDCPDYDTVLNAATGQHHLNDMDDGYNYSRNDGEYLHFNGSDAHGEIPAEFWDHVSVVCGRSIPKHVRATYFSCSC